MKSKQSIFLLGICISFFCLVTAKTAQSAGEEIKNVIQSGDLARLQALAEKDPGILASRDDEGQTLLHLAAEAGRLDIARWLIARGADIESKTRTGKRRSWRSPGTRATWNWAACWSTWREHQRR